MMSEAEPITVQPRISDQGENLENSRRKKKGCCQRFTSSFQRCFRNLTDCLDFWCCKNECYNLCCKCDDDEDTVAYVKDYSEGNIDEQADMTMLSDMRDGGDDASKGHQAEDPRGDGHRGYGHQGDNHAGSIDGGHHSASDTHGGGHSGDHSGGGGYCGGGDSGGGYSGGGDGGGGDSGGGDCGGYD